MKDILNSSIHNVLFKSCREQRSEWVVSSPYVRWVSKVRASGERHNKLGCTAQPSKCAAYICLPFLML
jgi:hypothetical protein